MNQDINFKPSPIHNIAFSSEKVVLSESAEKYAQAPFTS